MIDLGPVLYCVVNHQSMEGEVGSPTGGDGESIVIGEYWVKYAISLNVLYHDAEGLPRPC
jgi:hypothetical protein